MLAAFGASRHEHTLRWAAAVESFDGFVFARPEYNVSPPPYRVANASEGLSDGRRPEIVMAR